MRVPCAGPAQCGPTRASRVSTRTVAEMVRLGCSLVPNEVEEFARGVIGTAGNVSARQGDLIAVTPTGAGLAKVTAEMVTVIDLLGELVNGDLPPTSEVSLHTGIYAATDALAIANTHAMASTAVSCCFEKLPAVHY